MIARFLCKLGFHSWSHWHRVHTVVVTAGPNTVLWHDNVPTYLETRRCYDCGREEFHEFVR